MKQILLIVWLTPVRVRRDDTSSASQLAVLEQDSELSNIMSKRNSLADPCPIDAPDETLVLALINILFQCILCLMV